MSYVPNHNLTPELEEWAKKIVGMAQDFGLSFFPIEFLLVAPAELNGIAAYSGFPRRIGHWKYGQEFESIHKSYRYGASKIYELVINHNPVYAYLLTTNTLVNQKLVMAHVCGHADFFYNNSWFAHTSRRMVDQMANNAIRVRRIAEIEGEEAVEAFLDTCLSLENLVDPYSTGGRDYCPEEEEETYQRDAPAVYKLPAKEYLDSYINPKEFIEQQKAAHKAEKAQEKNFPKEADRDILGFLVEHAPLLKWQRDILAMIREEAYYFMPQRQTKVLNEGWACVEGKTLVFTDQGALPMEAVVAKVSCGEKIKVSGGKEVYDWNIIPNTNSLKVTTRRGYTLTGSDNHRVKIGKGWKRLDALTTGDLITLTPPNIWPSDRATISWIQEPKTCLTKALEKEEISYTTYRRYKTGHPYVSDEAKIKIGRALANPTLQLHAQQRRRTLITAPRHVTPELALFLGYLVGDGNISVSGRVVTLTSGDEPQIKHFADLAKSLFNLEAKIVYIPKEDLEKDWEDQAFLEEKTSGKWRAHLYSLNLMDFLVNCLGITTGFSAREKKIPDHILRSPKTVVSSFLKGLYDADGYAGEAGVILTTASSQMAAQLQTILLNYGVLTRRRLQKKTKDGKTYRWWHVTTTGKSALLFQTEIGFGLPRKQNKLQTYIQDRKWFLKETWDDEIVSVEDKGSITVYDISVRDSHCYSSGAFVNHNSFWHSKFMTNHLADASEIIDYCDVHAGVMSGGGFNPYKIGVELFRDIESRWDRGAFGLEYQQCKDAKERKSWDKSLGLGREKILQIRKTHNDVTFIDQYLTPEFCVEHELFAFKQVEGHFPFVEEFREFSKIKNQLLTQLANGGSPIIEIINANYNNRGELLLRHDHDGRALDKETGEDCMKNLYKIWSRAIHLQTVDKKGNTELWHYTGGKFIAGENSSDDDDPEFDLDDLLSP
jgi:stage V sporulation protein R